MSNPKLGGGDIVIQPVTPQEIEGARQRVRHEPDAADLLLALGIGPLIRILTTGDIA